ncbi:MAG: Holliday junction branch migration protein RuvA [Candidatus Magasanikbacteria bacterium]|nr:Holliday junction branch migration protein RuvA [Candidatus Magasanikbacteria bacterium]
MIALLSGVVVEKTTTSVLVETSGGVGYDVTMTAADALSVVLGEKLRVFTYLKVSDSAQELFGFKNTAARDFFKILLSVSGIGPKSALNVLSLGEITNIQSAIARGDVKYLTAVQGMGKKTAERLVVELKNKFTVRGNSGESLVDAVDSGPLGEVVEGLVAMGYSQAEARDVVQNLDATGKNSEGLLREALKLLSR